MNIVEEAARIIDPDAFQENDCIDAATGQPHDFGDLERSRRKLHQAQAVCRSIEVLKLAMAQGAGLRSQLIEDETARWKDLGMPTDRADVQAVIASKFRELYT